MSDAINKEAEDIKTMCGRCYAVNVPLYPSGCDEKPENLAGAPLGMYHCSDCGAMLIAGEPHPEVCELCRDRRHPGFDKIPEYNEGWSAYEAHARWTDCPYDATSDKEKYDAWQKGFEEAMHHHSG